MRVLDLSQIIAGPLCTLVLGDLGADVIKVEPPEGDSARAIGETRIGGESDYLISMSRNKRSVVIDLKTPAGVETLRALAATCDVVVENFRPGTVDRLGVGYDAIAAINPGIIYASVNGFGNEGPNRDRPALDTIVQALSGIMEITGDERTGPLKTGFPLADYVTPLYATIGIIAALYERNRTGKGQRVDVAMIDATLFTAIPKEQYFFAHGRSPKAMGNAHFQIVPAGTYRTSDGRSIMLMAHTDKYWRILAEALGDAALLNDERLDRNAGRVTQRAYVDERLAAAFASRSLAEWTEILERHGALFAPVRTLGEALTDPALAHMVVETDHPTAGRLKVLANPIRLSRTPATVRTAPPLLGQHTEEVLGELQSLKRKS